MHSLNVYKSIEMYQTSIQFKILNSKFIDSHGNLSIENRCQKLMWGRIEFYRAINASFVKFKTLPIWLSITISI